MLQINDDTVMMDPGSGALVPVRAFILHVENWSKRLSIVMCLVRRGTLISQIFSGLKIIKTDILIGSSRNNFLQDLQFQVSVRATPLLSIASNLSFCAGHGIQSSRRRSREFIVMLRNTLLSHMRKGFYQTVFNTRTGERLTASWEMLCGRSRSLLTETIAALQAFRKRHGDAQRIHAQYASQPTTVDFAHYRSVLRNTTIVDEAEKLLRDFKPVTYDVNAHVKAIETFEVKAVSPRNFASCLPPHARHGAGRESQRDGPKN